MKFHVYYDSVTNIQGGYLKACCILSLQSSRREKSSSHWVLWCMFRSAARSVRLQTNKSQTKLIADARNGPCCNARVPCIAMKCWCWFLDKVNLKPEILNYGFLCGLSRRLPRGMFSPEIYYRPSPYFSHGCCTRTLTSMCNSYMSFLTQKIMWPVECLVQ
jgi:hypothetical protein